MLTKKNYTNLYLFSRAPYEINLKRLMIELEKVNNLSYDKIRSVKRKFLILRSEGIQFRFGFGVILEISNLTQKFETISTKNDNGIYDINGQILIEKIENYYRLSSIRKLINVTG